MRPGGLHAGIGRADPPISVGTDKGSIAILTIDAVLASDAVLAIGTVLAIDAIFTVPAILSSGASSAFQTFQPLGLCSGGCKTSLLSDLVGGFSVAAILSICAFQGRQPFGFTECTAVFLRDFIGRFSGGAVCAVSTAGSNAGISCADPPVAIGTDIRRLPVGSGSAL